VERWSLPQGSSEADLPRGGRARRTLLAMVGRGEMFSPWTSSWRGFPFEVTPDGPWNHPSGWAVPGPSGLVLASQASL